MSYYVSKSDPRIWCCKDGKYYYVGITKNAVDALCGMTRIRSLGYQCPFSKGQQFAVIYTPNGTTELPSPFDGYCEHIYWPECNGPAHKAVAKNWRTWLAAFEAASVKWNPEEWEEVEDEQ